MDILDMDVFSIYTADDWNYRFKENEQENALSDLEAGKILYCPQLRFKLYPDERPLFIPYVVNKKTKNISFNIHTDSLRGIKADKKHCMQLKTMLTRFSQQAKNFMNALFPQYTTTLSMGRTSYRPVQIKNRKTSVRKDDSRLHVDAFPANPNQGKRILRLFCNINPYGENRVWRVGESFHAVVQHFLPKLSKPFPGIATLLHWAGITKSIRSHYDHIMLQLHDHMKLDTEYQKRVKYTEICFSPGSSWVVSTDQVSHAAISGQYMLEQTFYLPITAMKNPEAAPINILENFLGRPLI
ncbi:MAG: Kdo hydroxylase family protein [Rickettsiella sp.]|nr:Kdo hydroxylase family protein [Rickettsiella sp.]